MGDFIWFYMYLRVSSHVFWGLHVDVMSHSAMPNFLRSNAYSRFPLTVFTYVRRPSATIALTSPVHGAGRVEEMVVGFIVFRCVF